MADENEPQPKIDPALDTEPVTPIDPRRRKPKQHYRDQVSHSYREKKGRQNYRKTPKPKRLAFHGDASSVADEGEPLDQPPRGVTTEERDAARQRLADMGISGQFSQQISGTNGQNGQNNDRLVMTIRELLQQQTETLVQRMEQVIKDNSGYVA